LIPVLPATPPLHQADLASARASALERQPAVASAIASLQAAVQRSHALTNLRVPTFIARDLPIRREQADSGVRVAEAGVHLAQMNASYSVTYCYLSYLYALEQAQVTKDAMDGLSEIQGELEKIYSEDKPGNNAERAQRTIARLQIKSYMSIAKARKAEAEMGAERALSALREAMGLCPDTPIVVPRKMLPEVCLLLDKRILLDLAMKRRPEITQATLGASVALLEVNAQQTPQWLAFRVNTFASGSDIHANPLPAGSFDNEYRPGAVGPEMPVTINGSKRDRVSIAEAYAGRAETVVARTKLLIGLETDQAFLRWVEASKKLAHYREALQAAQERAEASKMVLKLKAPGGGLLGMPIHRVIDNGALASQMRAEVNKARYELLLALAQLERVTAGGFCARLDTAPDRPDDVEPAKAKGRRALDPPAKKDGDK
jgi:outer membrane protein TolC